MAEQIVKILEYLSDSTIFNAAMIVYAVLSVLTLIVVFAIFATVLKVFYDINKRNRRR